MHRPDEVAVERRARELAEQDGYTWELIYKPVIPGAPIKPQRYLSEERKQEYRARARAEGGQEGGNA